MDLPRDECCATAFEGMVTDIQKLVYPGYELEKVKNRKAAVTAFIEDVIHEITEIVPQMKVSEILLVGSFQEGTKIFEADEFDFLVVVEELSKPGTVVLDTASTGLPGTVNLKLSNDNSDGKWNKFCKQGYLSCFEAVYRPMIDDSFGYQAIKAIQKLQQNRGRRFMFPFINEITFPGTPPEVIYSRTRPIAHIAMIKNANVKHPNILLEFEFDGIEVTADLCPAIRYKCTEDCFNPELCYNEKLANGVLNKGSILLVGQENQLFRVTYTEVEVDFMKNKIQTRHKYLYRFLKVISHFFTDMWKPLPSYALKTICIKHDLLCENPQKHILTCFDEILEELMTSICEKYLPSAFDSRVNLFNEPFFPTHVFREKFVVPALIQIKDLCHNVEGNSASELLHAIKRVVKCACDGFNPLAPIAT